MSYYFFKEDAHIYMLYAYPKGEKDDLTADQLKQLKQLVEDQLLRMMKCLKNCSKVSGKPVTFEKGI